MCVCVYGCHYSNQLIKVLFLFLMHLVKACHLCTVSVCGPFPLHVCVSYAP